MSIWRQKQPAGRRPLTRRVRAASSPRWPSVGRSCGTNSRPERDDGATPCRANRWTIDYCVATWSADHLRPSRRRRFVARRNSPHPGSPAAMSKQGTCVRDPSSATHGRLTVRAHVRRALEQFEHWHSPAGLAHTRHYNLAPTVVEEGKPCYVKHKRRTPFQSGEQSRWKAKPCCRDSDTQRMRIAAGTPATIALIVDALSSVSAAATMA